MINSEPPPQEAHWLLLWKLNGRWIESKMWGELSGNIPAERNRKAEATQLKQHYAGKLLTLHTQLQLSLLWEWILSKAVIVRGRSASFESLLIRFTSWKCPQWLSRTVDCDVLSSSGVPLFSDTPHRSTLFVYLLQPVMGQYLGLRATPHFHLQSHSRQTSINGARWEDNEAPRRTEVGEWQSRTELSLSRRNERRTWKRSEAVSWSDPTEFGKLIPLCPA